MPPIALLLLSLLFAQQPLPGFGAISGQLRDSSGAPAAGIRVAVTPVTADAGTRILSNLTETDSEGRYRFQDVAPGRYLIMAGALSSPSFFPGVTARDEGLIVTIVAGQARANLDFALAPAAQTNPGFGANPLSHQTVVVVSSIPQGIVRLDDGLVPVSTMQIEINGQVELFRQGGGSNRRFFTLNNLRPGDNVVNVTQLPLGYYVKSMTSGGVDLMKAPLVHFAMSPGQIEIVLTKTAPAGAPRGVKVSGRLLTNEELPKSFKLSLLLTKDSPPVSTVRVGQEPRSITEVFAEGKDAEFEIRGVPPGRYTLQVGTPRQDGYTTILTFDVGDSDVTNLEAKYDLSAPATLSAKPGAPVPLNPGSKRTLSGTVEVANGRIPEFEIRFTATSGGAEAQSAPISGREFTVQLPEGEYRAGISGLPEGYALTSVTAGPFDLTEPFLVTGAGIADRFTGKPIPAGAVITVRLTTAPPAVK